MVVFIRRLELSRCDRPLPVGTYRILTEDEEIPRCSVLGHRRSTTVLQFLAFETVGGRIQIKPINAREREAALAADAP